MRVVFMGTPDFAVPSLAALVLGGHKVAGVITQPDRPRGRGKKIKYSPVKEIALAYGLEIFQPETIKSREFINVLHGLAPEVIVVVAYGRMLPREVLALPEKGCINVHASLLPKYRGAAPIHRAIINGEKRTGVTVMYMSEELDAGDIIRQAATDITDEDTAGTLHDRLAEMGAGVLLEALHDLEKGTVNRVKQEHEMATYAPPLSREDELIAWDKSSREVFNHVRGMNPQPGAYTHLEGNILKVWRVQVADDYCFQRGAYSHGKGRAPAPVQPANGSRLQGVPGEVLASDQDKGIIARTGSGAVCIVELQIQGKRKMTVAEFLRGRPVPPGTLLR